MSKLLTPAYLLDWLPPRQSDILFPAAILFAGAIIGSGVIWLVSIRKERQEPILRRPRKQVVTWLFVTGLIGLFLIFFRWQGIPYFSARIWMVLWIGVACIWLIAILIYLLKKFPKERRLYHERLLRERYLPKAKK